MKSADFNGVRFPAVYHAVTESTNDDAKAAINRGAADGTVIIAGSQTAGRGRQTKVFFSPDTGAYFSIILRPKAISDTAFYTIYAALAVCEAVEILYGVDAGIKWVNDVFVGGKKCAGILTEAVTAADGTLSGVVVGIGVNVCYPSGGFPDEIKDIAGALCRGGSDLRVNLIEETVNIFNGYVEKDDKRTAVKAYRERSVVLGKNIVVKATDGSFSAVAVDIADDGKLIVDADGVRKTLSAGEVSICTEK